MVRAVIARLRSKNRGQWLTYHQPPVRSLAVATISRDMKPSSILIGTGSLYHPGGTTGARRGANGLSS